jgi:hypothetical protein
MTKPANVGKTCGCPAGSKRVSTKGRGRGWACVSDTTKSLSPKVKKGWFKPFVKAICR